MDDISLLYESVLISEMTEDVIDYLNKNKEDLPFSKMFGDRLRLVVPIGGDLTAREILEDLKSIKDYSGIDVGAGEVIRKIKLDPKYGQGSEKEQKISIGKAVNSLKIDPEKKKKYLDWLAKYKDNLNTALSDISDYVIILSRAPIDVVRMSDHRNISSCHSRGGSYFQCAVQEAVTGGAVAYVVDRDILDDHLDDDGIDSLQDDDFFHDSDRGVRGIRPVSRLRVRRVESDDGEELGVPDEKIYGDSKIPGFWKYLNEFLKNNQKEVIQNFIDSDGRGWESRGGSYYDAGDEIDKLTSNFIGSEFRNRIHYNSDDSSNESGWATQGWDDELDEIKNRYNNSMTYCFVDYQLEEDEQPYIMPSGGCTIDISSFGLPDDTDLYIDDYYDIKRKGANGHYDDDYIWSYVVAYLIKQVGDAGIGRLEINNQSIDIGFYDEDYSNLNSPDAFDSDFCWGVERFDRKIEDMLEDPDELRHVFEEAGLLNATDYTNPEYSRYADYMENDENYSKISLYGERNDLKIIFDETIFRVSPVGSPPRAPSMQFTQWPQLFQKFIYNFAEEHFHPKIDVNVNQPTFKNFFESYTNPMGDIDFTVLPFQMRMNHFETTTPIYTITNEKIKLIPSGISNKYFEFFDFLDDIYPHLNNFFKMSVLMSISRDDPEMFEFYKHHNLPQLEKLYGKYIN